MLLRSSMDYIRMNRDHFSMKIIEFIKSLIELVVLKLNLFLKKGFIDDGCCPILLGLFYLIKIGHYIGGANNDRVVQLQTHILCFQVFHHRIFMLMIRIIVLLKTI